VIQESITSNIGEDLITLEFQKTDGTLITQVIDFRNVSEESEALESRARDPIEIENLLSIFPSGGSNPQGSGSRRGGAWPEPVPGHVLRNQVQQRRLHLLGGNGQAAPEESAHHPHSRGGQGP